MEHLEHIQDLLQTVTRLRSEYGCPWDRKQTPQSLIKYLRSETEELVHAIEAGDTENTCEELGDVLYLVVMIATIHSENDTFTFLDVVKNINDKLIRRHPHVFAGKSFKSEDELRQQWEEIKELEKKAKSD